MRKDYVRDVYGQLSRDYQGILITLGYAQEQMAGPPFSVPDSEVQMSYASHSEALVIDRRDILDKEPKFVERGLSALTTVVYCLRGKEEHPLNAAV
jgi:thiopurine S-methyltransferase